MSNFRFVWNPDAGAFTQAGYSVAAAYPGDAYVDVIGLDAYDQSWAIAADPDQRLVLDHPADAGGSAGSSPRRTASRWPSRSGASPSAATATGSVTTRTSSTRWLSWMENRLE